MGGNFIMQHTTEALQALGLRDINPGTWSGSRGWSTHTGGAIIDSINPATGQRLAQVRGATPQDYEDVMASAVAAAAAWRLVPAPKRGEAVRLIEKFTGKKPKGWLGPGLTETWETLELLREAGIEYVSDWVNDDQPYEIRTSAGPLVSVPYSVELNDIPMMVIQHHESSAWLQRCKDQFDRLYFEGAGNPRVMAMAVHPYISGVPHRIKYFEAVYDYIRKQKGVWLTTGEEIYQWYAKNRW